MSIMEATATKWAATMPIGRIGTVYTFSIREASDGSYILSIAIPGKVTHVLYDDMETASAGAEELMAMFGLKRL